MFTLLLTLVGSLLTFLVLLFPVQSPDGLWIAALLCFAFVPVLAWLEKTLQADRAVQEEITHHLNLTE